MRALRCPELRALLVRIKSVELSGIWRSDVSGIKGAEVSGIKGAEVSGINDVVVSAIEDAKVSGWWVIFPVIGFLFTNWNWLSCVCLRFARRSAPNGRIFKFGYSNASKVLLPEALGSRPTFNQKSVHSVRTYSAHLQNRRAVFAAHNFEDEQRI